jgi:hypothetical protein
VGIEDTGSGTAVVSDLRRDPQAALLTVTPVLVTAETRRAGRRRRGLPAEQTEGRGSGGKPRWARIYVMDGLAWLYAGGGLPGC